MHDTPPPRGRGVGIRPLPRAQGAEPTKTVARLGLAPHHSLHLVDTSFGCVNMT